MLPAPIIRVLRKLATAPRSRVHSLVWGDARAYERKCERLRLAAMTPLELEQEHRERHRHLRRVVAGESTGAVFVPPPLPKSEGSMS